MNRIQVERAMGTITRVAIPNVKVARNRRVSHSQTVQADEECTVRLPQRRHLRRSLGSDKTPPLQVDDAESRSCAGGLERGELHHADRAEDGVAFSQEL